MTISDGVYLAVLEGTGKAIMKIDETKCTKIHKHEEEKVTYFVQRGYVVVDYNNKKYLLGVGDTIIINESKSLSLTFSLFIELFLIFNLITQKIIRTQ